MTERRQVTVAPRAFADLTGIRDYLMERNPAGAESVRLAINATLELLARHPRLGRNRPDLGVRAIGVPRYKYTIYYRIFETEIVIVHVRDERRRSLRPDDI